MFFAKRLLVKVLTLFNQNQSIKYYWTIYSINTYKKFIILEQYYFKIKLDNLILEGI